MYKAIVGLAVVGALLLVVAGCGGDDSSISRQEYDQQIELVCNKGLQEREELLNDLTKEFEEQGRSAGTKVQEENVRKLIAVYQGTTEEIADLGFPEQGEKKAEELVQAREEAASKVEADPLGSLGATATTFDKAVAAAEDLEAKSCAA